MSDNRQRAQSFDTSLGRDVGGSEDPLEFLSYLDEIDLKPHWDIILQKARQKFLYSQGEGDGQLVEDYEALIAYINEDYNQINQITSGRYPPAVGQNQERELFFLVEKIVHIDILFDLMPLTETASIVYRCYESGQLPPYPVVEDGNLAINSFLSTSASKNWLSRRVEFCNPDRLFMICIFIPPGSRVIPMLDHQVMQMDRVEDGQNPNLITTEYEILLDQYGRLKAEEFTHRGVPVYTYVSPSEEERNERKTAQYDRFEQLLPILRAGGGKRKKRKRRICKTKKTYKRKSKQSKKRRH